MEPGKLIIKIAALLFILVQLSAYTMADRSAGDGIPYEIADRYFLKNDVGNETPSVITDAAEFNEYFGMATVMGGIPTPIDFSQNYVITVVLPQTDTVTRLEPVSLKQGCADKIIFTYKVIKGEKVSYTMRPILVVIVDRQYGTDVQVCSERN